ncbi:MAG: hypothetical protein ACLFU8_17230 [Anaerolineales bacterium]
MDWLETFGQQLEARPDGEHPLSRLPLSRYNLDLALESLPAHHPDVVRTAVGMLYWAAQAVRTAQLAPGDADLILQEAACRTSLLPQELVACAEIVYRLRAGLELVVWPTVEQAAVGAWIETYVYGTQQLMSVSGFYALEKRSELRPIGPVITFENVSYGEPGR